MPKLRAGRVQTTSLRRPRHGGCTFLYFFVLFHHPQEVQQTAKAEASVSGTRVIVVLEHCSRNGKSKIVEDCDLPLTGSKCVDMVITEKAVFKFIDGKGLTLLELAEGVSLEDVKACTGCQFAVDENLSVMK